MKTACSRTISLACLNWGSSINTMYLINWLLNAVVKFSGIYRRSPINSFRFNWTAINMFMPSLLFTRHSRKLWLKKTVKLCAYASLSIRFPSTEAASAIALKNPITPLWRKRITHRFVFRWLIVRRFFWYLPFGVNAQLTIFHGLPTDPLQHLCFQVLPFLVAWMNSTSFFLPLSSMKPRAKVEMLKSCFIPYQCLSRNALTPWMHHLRKHAPQSQEIVKRHWSRGYRYLVTVFCRQSTKCFLIGFTVFHVKRDCMRAPTLFTPLTPSIKEGPRFPLGLLHKHSCFRSSRCSSK